VEPISGTNKGTEKHLNVVANKLYAFIRIIHFSNGNNLLRFLNRSIGDSEVSCVFSYDEVTEWQ